MLHIWQLLFMCADIDTEICQMSFLKIAQNNLAVVCTKVTSRLIEVYGNKYN